MYRVQLADASQGTAAVVLSPTPYPDETWTWLRQEAEDEACDGLYGPARRRLDRVKRELGGARGGNGHLTMHRKHPAGREIA